MSKDDSDAAAVMDKIQFYTTELHRLLDLVDGNKKSKKARKKKTESRFSQH